MAKPKEYRRFIRIDGRVVSSPRFTKKRDADQWYDQVKRQKNFAKFGLKAASDKELLFLDYARSWMKDRVARYPMATWSTDDQRLRDYLLPEFADIPIAKITSKMIRATLKRITDEGKSIKTRTRVKALASKIFGDAFNEELIPFNPVLGIRFNDPRQGAKKPETLSPEEAKEFLDAAQEIGEQHHVVALLGLTAGLRKSEMLALKKSDIDFKNGLLHIQRRLELASHAIIDGTKGGRLETRIVPVPEFTAYILKISTKDYSNSDFVLRGRFGSYMSHRRLHAIVEEIANRAKVKISAHGLRHTYGRTFVRNGGSIKALQAILGHSTSQQTDLYSNLGGETLSSSRDVVSYGGEK